MYTTIQQYCIIWQRERERERARESEIKCLNQTQNNTRVKYDYMSDVI